LKSFRNCQYIELKEERSDFKVALVTFENFGTGGFVSLQKGTPKFSGKRWVKGGE